MSYTTSYKSAHTTRAQRAAGGGHCSAQSQGEALLPFREDSEADGVAIVGEAALRQAQMLVVARDICGGCCPGAE
jgi:hypothetical protein